MKKLYYFAYGSNIGTKRIEDRLGPVKKISTHKLQGYGMAFNAGSWLAFANILPREGQYTEGVLYELTDAQIYRLDTYEGWPRNYRKEYFVLSDGNIAFAYIANILAKKDSKPSLDYINIMLDGCLEHGLITTYNLLVDYKNKNYPLKKGNRHKYIEV